MMARRPTLDGHELVSSSPLHRSLLGSTDCDEDKDRVGVMFFEGDRQMVLSTPPAHEGSASKGLIFADDDEGLSQWRTHLGIVYMAAMAMCSVVLCALGATLDTLASNCGLNALSLSSVYIARGAGAVCGAMASSSIYRLTHGNHALALALALLSLVLLALPPTSSPAILHLLFSMLGIATSTIDTGVQIMTRKAHGAGAGPWLGANTLAFGVAGAAVPVVSLMAGGRDAVVFLVFAAFAVVTGTTILGLRVPSRIGEAVDGRRFKGAMVSRRKGFAPPVSVSAYAIEASVAVAAFLVIGGQVALTSYIVTYVTATRGTSLSSSDATAAGGKDDDADTDNEGMLILSLLWGCITVGRFAGLWRQVRLSRACDEEDARTTAGVSRHASDMTAGTALSPRSGVGPGGQSQRRGSHGMSAHDSEGAVSAVLGELRFFLAVAVMGGVLMVSFDAGRVNGGGSKAMWLLGLALFGVGNGPALGLLYDYANRTTVASEMGTSVVMFGLNLGASIVPWATARAWAATQDPSVLTVTALVSSLLPLPLMEALHRWQLWRRKARCTALANSSGDAAFAALKDQEAKDDKDIEDEDRGTELTDGLSLARAFSAHGAKRPPKAAGKAECKVKSTKGKTQASVDLPSDVDTDGEGNSEDCPECPGDDPCHCSEANRPLRHSRTKVAAATALLVAFVAVAGALAAVVRGDDLIGPSSATDDAPAPVAADDEATGDDASPVDPVVIDPLGMAAEYDYTLALGPIGLDYPWAEAGRVVVVDVGKSLTLKATGARGGCSLKWLVDGGRVHHASSDGGATWMGKFSDVGVYPASLTERCGEVGLHSDGGASDGGATSLQRTVNGYVVATWVRRELRELTPADLARFMDAMLLCYSLSTLDGQAIYGPNFVGLDTFQLWHHLNSGQRDADHFHQGVGFVAQHAKVSRLFELSLQAIDPTLSLPYWDPSIEMALVAKKKLPNVWHSPLWSADMFGSINGYLAEDYNMTQTSEMAEDVFGPKGVPTDANMRRFAIPDGRFAYFKLPTHDDASGLPPGTPLNSYGFLRAPWNNNPSPYVSRYPSAKQEVHFPSCAELRTFALGHTKSNKDGDWTATAWMYGVSNKPHGNMHAGPGGTVTLNNNDLMPPVVGSAIAASVREHTLWRFRIIEFPETCPADSPPSECRATCNFNLWSKEHIGFEVLKAQIYLPSTDQMAAWKADPSFLVEVADAYCGDMTVSFSGDAKDSGGCVDPSFWPIHPHVERLYQFRILKGPGFVADPTEQWPGQRTCFGARSNDFDPDHLCYKGMAFDDPITGQPVQGDDESCCGGHHAESRIFASYPNAVKAAAEAAAEAPAVGAAMGATGSRFWDGVDQSSQEGLSGGALEAGGGVYEERLRRLSDQRTQPSAARGQRRRRKLHHHDDDGPFAGLSDDEDEGDGTVGPSSRVMVGLLDPRTGPNFNYPVYHHFRWDHCAAAGLPFVYDPVTDDPTRGT